jgi:SAM-dependent methyltransferase
MEHKDAFIDVACTPALLDKYIVRNAILRALRQVLPRLRGTVLDVGSGSMPYRSFLLQEGRTITSYIGLDFKPHSRYPDSPDIAWDGRIIPLHDRAVDCALATEVFEHLPHPESVMAEILRVLKPGGLLFFTVPFLWRLHDVPYDEYRYTPFALQRHLKNTGFSDICIEPLGGPDASLGQVLALWVKGRSRGRLYRLVIGPVLALLCTPIVWLLYRIDRRPAQFHEGALVSGLSGTAVKPRENEGRT